MLIVVVRYFGGIKLGIPGLIRAYRTAASDALAHAEIIGKTASVRYRLSFGYMAMNDVMKTLKDIGLTPVNQDFGMSCTLETSVRLTLEETFIERMKNIAGLQALDRPE